MLINNFPIQNDYRDFSKVRRNLLKVKKIQRQRKSKADNSFTHFLRFEKHKFSSKVDPEKKNKILFEPFVITVLTNQISIV